MDKVMNQIVEISVTLLYYASLAVALRKLLEINIDPIIKKLFWYPLVGSIVSVFWWLKEFHVIARELFFVINTSSLVFHYLFLSILIYVFSGKNSTVKWLILLFCILITVIIYFDIKNHNSYSFAVANFCLFLFSCFYFYNLLFSHPSSIALTQNPIFFICCGVFLGSGIIIPFSLMGQTFRDLHVSTNVIYLLASISALGYGVINIFFLKAFLCLRRQKS